MEPKRKNLENEFINFFIKDYKFPLTLSDKKWLIQNCDKLMDCKYLEKDFIDYFNFNLSYEEIKKDGGLNA